MKITLLTIFLSISVSSFGQYVFDSTKTCKYWMPFADESFTLKWSGKCKDGLPNDTGTLIIGNKYYKALEFTGNIKNAKFEGHGTLELWQRKYEGNFLNGHFLNLNKELLKNLNRNKINQIDTTDIFISLEEYHDLFYFSLIPAHPTMGTIVLFPSLWERPESVLSNNVKLCEYAFKNNLAILVPSINYNMCLTNESTSFVNKVIQDAIKRYKLPKDKFILGGFSLGGINSLRYAELSFEDSSATVMQPLAVFGIDPPVNFIALHEQMIQTLRDNPNSYEAKTVIQKFDKIIGGEPKDHLKEYEYRSIHTTYNTNAKFLKSIPVRIYCDPDIDWYINNRNQSYKDMNALYHSDFIVYLKSIGNNKADFINQLGKGFGLDGTRQPHSWSLLEPTDCINWILKILK